jgi:uncharacterized protein
MRLFLFLLISVQLHSQNTTPKISLADAALQLTKDKVIYDPAYVVLKYPMGDVPANKGVCTDVVIRAYRKLEIDLQRLVHEDISRNFSIYPKKWGRKKADKNIDHRRVYNLMKFFERFGTVKKISNQAKDYQPGDIVCWLLGGKLSHIGIVSSIKSSDDLRYQIVHNIGSGQVLEDVLFDYEIIGHYTYP